ncbi:MAG: RnfABCDGE type electron transport complex subunit D [Lachnospiraceae bacterium]|nr:RnfABCDGE type electron transport complex subunit D [Lachnospiraceae bacterium]
MAEEIKEEKTGALAKEAKKEEKAALRSVSSTPHIRDKSSTRSIMATVIIALLPATGVGIITFGPKTLLLLALSIGSAVLCEWGFEKITKQKSTVSDLSAVLTGLLLALNLPVAVPWWMPVLGAFFAIVVVKMLFGGLGQNFMNPALGARCFLVLSFSRYMTDFSYHPGWASADAVSSATPLAEVKAGGAYDVLSMFIGNEGGTIGETSAFALLIGGLILIFTGVISWHLSTCYLLSMLLFAAIFGGHGFDPLYLAAQLGGGGLMLGAFFMATDYVTRPITRKGQVIYGIFLGILTGIFRIFGPGAEGVSYAIIIGNLLVPLIERITEPKHFGYKKPVKAEKKG